MYRPQAYDCADRARAMELVVANPFGVIVTAADGMIATHIPLLPRRYPTGEYILFGHMARSNPQAAGLAMADEALCIFTAEHGYVSPRWYADEEDVPTWNYSAVHVYGKPQLLKDERSVRQLLDDTVDHFEADFEEPWRLDRADQSMVDRFQRGITAFCLSVSRIEAAVKLGQDKSVTDRRRVIKGADARVEAGRCPMARAMQRDLEGQ